MTPFADFNYFGLLLYVVLPTLVLGWFGRANARWALFATVLAIAIQCSDDIPIVSRWHVREIWIVVGYIAWQAVIACAFLRWKSRVAFYVSLALAIVPLVGAKTFITHELGIEFGFGMSYVTFRALDVLFSIHDGVIKFLSPVKYLAFLLFFPTISSGPIDRYRRFTQDYDHCRTRAEFLDDLDLAVDRIFRGFLYKFLVAALIRKFWMDPLETAHDAWHLTGYMYAYSLYLFFDFAGYSAFAIGLSHLFGIRSPENFDRPFLSRNIRDFWNRWHISLSFWFRDHIYMRFLIAAAKGKWFKGKHTASYIGLWLTFGLMGVWHGLAPHFLLYGVYHAALLCGYDTFARWNKQMKRWPDTRAWRIANVVITFHVVCFGLLIFSGKLTQKPSPAPPAPAVATPQ